MLMRLAPRGTGSRFSESTNGSGLSQYSAEAESPWGMVYTGPLIRGTSHLVVIRARAQAQACNEETIKFLPKKKKPMKQVPSERVSQLLNNV